MDANFNSTDLKRRWQLQPACDLAVEIMRLANKPEQAELVLLQIRRVCLKALQDAGAPEVRAILGTEREDMVRGLPEAPGEPKKDLKVSTTLADSSFTPRHDSEGYLMDYIRGPCGE